ncbi:Wadjet anti-phage system protein JetA family protein [Aquabacterium sp. UBA2148]|uniref:Wadjet anti-phage system protein JetA family protein n=1 Tax=Aquabacterium sp. UBA2148 TaxID=1946042 RepID=UPI0025807631|nr:Wadjet anti-phage system protein JetA family protein [Aquabacterium sp. UBA2148]
MSAPTVFFQGPREHFFKPLSWQDREACAAVLRQLHERVHGPDADYAEALTRELVLEIIQQVIAQPAYRTGALSQSVAASGIVQPQAERDYALNLLRVLKEHGWLEDHKDPINLQPTLKLTRAGKAFSEAFAELDNARHKTRQRNMRSARKALQAFLENRDEDELLDAYDFASHVVQDLQEDIEYFRLLMQTLTREALTQKLAWDEFNDFLERRFGKELSSRLVADSVDRHRSQIIELLDMVRSWPEPQRQAVDGALRQRATWLEGVLEGRSATIWLCKRIEDLIDTACQVKLPMLRSEMHNYVRRFTSLLRQALSLDYGAESPMGRTLAGIKTSTTVERDAWLNALAQRLSTTEIRLPTSGLRWTQRDRQELDGSDIDWHILPHSRLEAAMRRAEAEAFVISEDFLLAQLQDLVKGCEMNGSLRLSDLSMGDAPDALRALHAVGAVRSAQGKAHWTAHKLPVKFETPVFVADDFELRRREP